MKTWDDVIEAAKGKPWTEDVTRLDVTGHLFHKAVTLVEMGEMTREQAMIAVALTLAEVVQRQHDQIVDLRNTMPFAPMVIPKAHP
jgi:hypothetical protein